jgi:conjugal transfer pilus assembly protein TrbC
MQQIKMLVFAKAICLPVLAIAGAALLSPLAAADIPAMPDTGDYASQAARQKSAAALDSAAQAARGGALPSMPNVRLPRELGVDIDQIASRYKAMGRVDKQDEDLMVFVSASMPMASLVKLGKQARLAGAVLVLRGIEGGLSHGAWKQAMDRLKPVVETGAAIQIHPDLYRIYRVTQVPTFVLAEPETTECAMDATRCHAMLRATGDVSLGYVLDRWADTDGPLADKARARLKRMGGVL